MNRDRVLRNITGHQSPGDRSTGPERHNARASHHVYPVECGITRSRFLEPDPIRRSEMFLHVGLLWLQQDPLQMKRLERNDLYHLSPVLCLNPWHDRYNSPRQRLIESEAYIVRRRIGAFPYKVCFVPGEQRHHGIGSHL